MARAATKGAFNHSFVIDPSPSKLANAFGRASKFMGDYRDAWRALTPHLAKGIAQNISSRGGAIGESWPQSDAAYLARKARKGFGRADLFMSGAMVAQATSGAGVLTMSQRSLRFGTNKPYARAVNFGSIGKSRARKFMGWNPAMIAAGEMALSASVKAKLERLARDLGGTDGG